MKMTLLAVCALLLAACAVQPPRMTNTAWPQAVINAPADALHGVFLAKLTSVGATIQSSTDSIIQATMPQQGNFWTKAMMGCASCADPYGRMNVIFSPADGGTLVIVQYWTEIPQPNGSATRVEDTNNKDFNSMQVALQKLQEKYANKAGAQD